MTHTDCQSVRVIWISNPNNSDTPISKEIKERRLPRQRWQQLAKWWQQTQTATVVRQEAKNKGGRRHTTMSYGKEGKCEIFKI